MKMVVGIGMGTRIVVGMKVVVERVMGRKAVEEGRVTMLELNYFQKQEERLASRCPRHRMPLQTKSMSTLD